MLRQALVKLAHDNPKLRKHLVPLLQKTAGPAGFDSEADFKAWKKEMNQQITSHRELAQALDGSDDLNHVRITDWVNDMNGQNRNVVRYDLKQMEKGQPCSEEGAVLLPQATGAALRNLRSTKAQYRTPEEKQMFNLLVKRMLRIDWMVNDYAEQSINYHKSH